ncbi:MAG: recombinase family protein [Allorhizobium sp.]
MKDDSSKNKGKKQTRKRQLLGSTSAAADIRPGVEQKRLRLQGALSRIESQQRDRIFAVIYCRVSEERSAEHNLSIPDQERQGRRRALDEGWTVVKVYKEEGRSGKTTSGRPVFQKMIEEALSADLPFQKIIVHSTSRFARNQADYATICKKLYEHGVGLVSVTQHFAKDTGGFIAQSASVMFDEFHSQRTSIDVSRTMTAMARDGYSPGGRLPLGYMAVVADDNPRRKRIVVNEEERPLVLRILHWALYGDEQCPPLGIKAIVNRLNSEGVLTRSGSRISSGFIHGILLNPIYMGVRVYNENAKDHQWAPQRSERIEIPVPAIISELEFEELQKLLQSKSPRTGAAKSISSPMLLAGIARCKCGGAMTLRTGTGKMGPIYRYYHCSRVAREGKFACSGPSIPEGLLDQTVIDTVVSKVLHFERLKSLLSILKERFREENSVADGRMMQLKGQLSRAEIEFNNLMLVVKHSKTLASQPIILGQLSQAEQEMTRVRNSMKALMRDPDDDIEITDQKIQHFSNVLISHLRDGSKFNIKSYLRSVVSRIDVGDRFIRIVGKLTDLGKGITEQYEEIADETRDPRVRGYKRRWCPRQDSNP